MEEEEQKKREQLSLGLDSLIKDFYTKSGQLSGSFELFKETCGNIINQLLNENASLKLHIKQLESNNQPAEKSKQ